MNYTHLGRTGLKVSRLCLGTMNFGDVTDETTSFRILDEALEAGINFIDTADVYGTEQSPDIKQGSGLSEEIIGRWLEKGGRCDRIVLATKVYQQGSGMPADGRLIRWRPAGLKVSCLTGTTIGCSSMRLLVTCSGSHGLFNGGVMIETVYLIQVHIVHSEPCQAVINRLK